MRPLARHIRGGVPAFVDAFLEHDLLTYASAISFQIFSALVPFLAFALALMGFFSLDTVWSSDIAPQLKSNVSPAAFNVVNSSVLKILTTKQVFWVTAGLLIAIWQISGAVRAVMGAFNKLYRTDEHRTFWQRMGISFALSIAVALLFLLAVAIVGLGPLLYGEFGTVADVLLFLVRWGAAAGLFLCAVGLLVRFGPEQHQPLRWVSFGSVLVILAWVVMSIGFGVYLTSVASYGSIFGNFATVVVLIAYIYMSALVLLGGIQIDALVREQIERERPD